MMHNRSDSEFRFSHTKPFLPRPGSDMPHPKS
jgi:hypothetical protein